MTSSVSGQNINLIPTDPQLKDLLDYFKKALKLEFNCHHVATVTSFDSEKQTVNATINYQKTFLQMTNGVQSTGLISYPLAVSCPVIILGGGGGGVTFPIAAGDECLLLFNDRDIDNWFNGSSNSPPATARLHAFTDAFALIGVHSLATSVASYSTDSVTFFYGSVKFQLYTDKVLITLSETVTLEYNTSGKLKIHNTTGEFVTALFQLFTDIQAAVTSVTGETLVMPTFPVDLLVFQSFKS